MSDWIRALAASFAKRCRQEAEMQEQNWETNWFVAHPEVMRFILKHEEAQALIGRTCASPLVIQYEEDDPIIHTDTHPFCDDPACCCHDDVELIMEHLERPFDAGLLTEPEKARIKEGKQL